MGTIKQAVREIETEVKARLRDLDARDLGAGAANARDEIRTRLANAGDRARAAVDDARDAARHELRHERVVRKPAKVEPARGGMRRDRPTTQGSDVR